MDGLWNPFISFRLDFRIYTRLPRRVVVGEDRHTNLEYLASRPATCDTHLTSTEEIVLDVHLHIIHVNTSTYQSPLSSD
ncbi:hypothetical protein M758_4G225400 [Ceratodon purpureus]|uniref:Uncharacterized protein n=1 Tax=Ceratodon purpureus TaxID=3225 RepID=A0A8T0IDU2_CERPU|nr:hypothetical protein KC19_4G221100 [Ceratodon purpureus]KAG0620557.1 hypothetical protein M758_4G225400 [Ceratodon purpureus]